MIRAGKLHFVIDQQQFLQGHLAVALLTVNAYTGHHLEDVLLETGRLFGKNPREVASVACLENAFKRCYEQAIAPAQPPPPTVVSSDSTGWIVWAVVASIALAGCAVVFRWGWKKNEKLAKTRREQDEIKEHERESRAHVLAHDKHMDAIEGEAQPDEQKSGILRNASAKRFGHKALRARSRRQIAERLDEEEKKRLLETCSLFRRCSVEQLTKFAERLTTTKLPSSRRETLQTACSSSRAGPAWLRPARHTTPRRPATEPFPLSLSLMWWKIFSARTPCSPRRARMSSTRQSAS